MELTVEDRKERDPLTARVIACAMEVHTALGPGLLESIYEQCLAHELTATGVSFKRQHPFPIHYKGVQMESGFRADLFVAGKLIIELKSVDVLMPIHQAQLLTYLKLARCRTGLLINFNVAHLRQGLKRLVL